MSVELNSAHTSPKALSKSDASSKTSGKATANEANGNFALMLNMLCASDTAMAETQSTELALSDPGMVAPVMPLALLMSQVPGTPTATKGSDAVTSVGAFLGQVLDVAQADGSLTSASVLTNAASVGAMSKSLSFPSDEAGSSNQVFTSSPIGQQGFFAESADVSAQDGTPVSANLVGVDSSPGVAQAVASAGAPVGSMSLERPELSVPMPDLDAATEPVGGSASMVVVKPAVPAVTIRPDAKEARVQLSARAEVVPAAVGASDAGRMVSDWVAVAPSQAASLKPTGTFSGTGFEGVLGASGDLGVRDHPVYEVTQATAVVPEPELAETVSYWASHGVQTAELTLEGFGEEPVEVSIMLNGDQAQIDFRTDQAEVRQALENASSQLKELLSGEGLQLTGVSVGSSGKGNMGGEARHESSTVQKFTRTESAPTPPAVTRSANPSVGRSLDLFV